MSMTTSTRPALPGSEAEIPRSAGGIPRQAVGGHDADAPARPGRHSQDVLRATASADVYQSLLRYSCSLCRDQHLAEDLVQDVIVRAIEQSHQFQGTGTVEGWLKSILRTTFLMAVRSKREWPAPVRDSEVLSAEEEAIEHLSRIALRESLSRVLTDQDRLVVDLYYGQGLSMRSIARLIGSTECAVKCHLYRMRRRLAASEFAAPATYDD